MVTERGQGGLPCVLALCMPPSDSVCADSCVPVTVLARRAGGVAGSRASRGTRAMLAGNTAVREFVHGAQMLKGPPCVLRTACDGWIVAQQLAPPSPRHFPHAPGDGLCLSVAC